jgi:hypothetical protein
MLPGLVRYGVAPDHAETKNVTTEFDQVRQQRAADSPRMLPPPNLPPDPLPTVPLNRFSTCRDVTLSATSPSERTCRSRSSAACITQLSCVTALREILPWASPGRGSKAQCRHGHSSTGEQAYFAFLKHDIAFGHPSPALWRQLSTLNH